MSRRFALFANPTAAKGRARHRLPQVRAELDRLGAEHRLVDARGVDEMVRQAAAAAAGGEIVVALGGDGTIGKLAGALRDQGGAMAVVPAGRGNDFARALGIPRSVGDAARVAVEGRERLIDVGEVDGATFVGIASVGFDSDVQEIANASRLNGGPVYLYSALRAAAGWDHATFEAVVDGRRLEVTGWSVAVANSGVYGGGMWLVPHARLDDGNLDVLTIARHGRLRFLVNLARVFRGAHVNDPAARFATGETVELRADRPFAVYADGDRIGALPVTIRIRTRALRVIVPRG